MTMAAENWERYFDAVKREDWKTARRILQDISRTEKDNPQTYIKIGDVCQRTGDKAEAVASYSHAAQLLRMQGFAQKAMAAYKIALRLDPRNPEIINCTEVLMEELEAARAAHHAHAAPAPSASPGRPGSSAAEDAAARARDEWLESACEAIDTKMFKPQAEQRVDRSQAPADDVIALVHNEERQAGDEIAEAVQEFLTPLSERQEKSTPEIFHDLPAAAAADFMNELPVLSFSDRQHIIEEGDSGDSMFIIKRGATRVVAHILGREIELAQLGEGDIFGEVGFLTGRPRTAAVIAAGPVEVYELSRPGIERLIESNPDVIARIEDFYECRVRDTIRKIRS